MSGSLQRIARWLRLALACLTVAGASAPAHALPRTEAAVTAVLVELHEPSKPRAAAETLVHAGQPVAGGARVLSWTSSTSRILETHPPGPPYRLFILHRALLL